MPGVALPAPMLKVEEFPAVTEVGLSDAVAPEGCPLTDSEMVPAEPEATPVEMALVPEFPWTRLRLVGEAEMEKSLGGVMLRATLIAWVTLVPVPVTVRL